MKRLYLLGLGCVLGTSGLISFVDAAPRGPSARAAARLKKNPTSRWLAHYLPDDRYKIAGNVWKYVSTDLDTYYHRPDSPNMLRQPADRVIGFASAQEAEDAGYLPDPTDGTAAAVEQRADAAIAAQAVASGDTNSGPIVLSDGASRLTLPAGWRRMLGQANKSNGMNFSIDMVVHQKTGNAAMLLTMIIPGQNVGATVANPRLFTNNLKQFSRVVDSSGRVSNAGMGSQLSSAFANSKVVPVRWGGLKGIRLTVPATNGRGSESALIVGRGSKMYMFQAISKSGSAAPGLSKLVSSFQPR